MDKDPTSSVQSKLNKYIDKLHKDSTFTDVERKYLRCDNGVFPKLYLLPYIHKQNIPLKSIVSFVGSPIYNLSTYLSGLLNHVFEIRSYHTKKSFEVVKELQNPTIKDKYDLDFFGRRLTIH